MLVELTTVPPEALPVARLKEHLRLASGFADDAVQNGLLAGFLRAALAAIEGRTGKALFARKFRLLRVEARDGALALPVEPVSGVAEVARLDCDGGEVVLEPGGWRLDCGAYQPRVRLDTRAGTFRVDFLAGYGPEFDDLPPDLQQAVMLLAAHYHDYRHDRVLAAGCAPFGVTTLLERYRRLRVGSPGSDRGQS